MLDLLIRHGDVVDGTGSARHLQPDDPVNGAVGCVPDDAPAVVLQTPVVS